MGSEINKMRINKKGSLYKEPFCNNNKIRCIVDLPNQTDPR